MCTLCRTNETFPRELANTFSEKKKSNFGEIRESDWSHGRIYLYAYSPKKKNLQPVTSNEGIYERGPLFSWKRSFNQTNLTWLPNRVSHWLSPWQLFLYFSRPRLAQSTRDRFSTEKRMGITDARFVVDVLKCFALFRISSEKLRSFQRTIKDFLKPVTKSKKTNKSARFEIRNSTIFIFRAYQFSFIGPKI